MTALIATELLKVRLARLSWGFAAAAVLLAAVRTGLVVLSAGTAAGVTAGTEAASVTMVSAAGLGTLALLLFGACAVSGEVRHATLTATLLSTPRRRSVVVAKMVAYAACGAVVGSTLVGGALIGAAATGLAGPLTRDVALTAVAVVAGAVLLTCLGVGIGLLVGNQTVALSIPVLWLLVVEPLTRSFGLGSLTAWLPGSLPGELGPVRADGSLPPLLAAVVLTGYVLLIGLLGVRRLEHLDVG